MPVYYGTSWSGGELQAEATVREDLTVQTEGTRQIRRTTMFYNLDMILAVGCRRAQSPVRSMKTQRAPCA